MSFFYLPRRLAAASRFLQYIGLLCLACSCRQQPLHAAAAPAHQDEDLAAILDELTAPPGFYSWAAFILAGRWLCVPIGQHTVAVWSPAGGGEGGWSVHALDLSGYLPGIRFIQAWTSTRQPACETEKKAIEAALNSSRLWIETYRYFPKPSCVYHVREKRICFVTPQQAQKAEASWVWLEGDESVLSLNDLEGGIPPVPIGHLYMKAINNKFANGASLCQPNCQESHICAISMIQDVKNLVRHHKWTRRCQSNLLLADNQEGGGKGKNFATYRMITRGGGIKIARIAVIPGIPTEEPPPSEYPAGIPVPLHMKKILTVARTIAGGAECLVALAEVDVEGKREREAHLYINPGSRINPSGCVESPDQIIRLARGRSWQLAAGAFLFHLGPYGLFYGVGTQDSRPEKLSLFFYPFLPGKRGLDLLAAGFIRQQYRAELSTDLESLLVKFCSPLPPTGLGKGVLLNPSPKQLGMLLAC